MKRVAIFIAFMLIGFTSCDKLRDDSHFIHDAYKVMYGEYEVTSVICFQDEMPEHLIEPATAKIQEGRSLQDGSKLTINQDMTYSLKESDLVVSSGRYAQSCLTLCDPMNTAHQASLSMGFSRQEHWIGLPFPS